MLRQFEVSKRILNQAPLQVSGSGITIGVPAPGGKAVADPGRQVRGRFIYFIFRVARCPVFSRTVRYFGPLLDIRMIVIPDKASVNSSIFFATNIDIVNVRYF